VTQLADTVADTLPERKRRGAFADFFVRLVKEKPLGTFGGVIVVFVVVLAVFADLGWMGLPNAGIAPYPYDEIHPPDRLKGPSLDYLLGTDHLGRDVLTRVVYGARVSVSVGLAATAFSIIISTVIGALTGFIGGKVDVVVQRFVDAWMCFPGLILLMVLVSLTGVGLWQVILVLGLQYGITGSRSVRGPVMAIRENVYIEAANAIGASTSRVILRHIVPNVLAPIIILFTTRIPGIIMAEASLSFLGLGIPPPTPSWGGMLSGVSRTYMIKAPWMAIWPGLFLGLLVYGINMFGDALRDLVDPRLRGGVGSYAGTAPRKGGILARWRRKRA
jgi:peptide/nickel transport system permease protein